MQASAFRRTSFDHITSRFGVEHLRARAPRRARARRRARASAPPSAARRVAMLTSRNGLVCTTTPGSGRSASTRIEPASTVSGGEAPAQHREVVEPVEQRQHERRARPRCARAPRRARRPWSRRSARPRARRSRATARGRATKLAERDAAARAMPRSAIARAVASRATTITSWPAPVERAAPAARRRRPGPSTAIFTRAASSSTPGFMHARGVDGRLGAAQRRGERLGPLAFVPGAVVAPDRVVVGDRRRPARSARRRPPA